MALQPLAISGNTAVGHTDVTGAVVTGTITATTFRLKIDGNWTCFEGDLVTFPSHPHCYSDSSPSCFRTHSVEVVPTGKIQVESALAVRNGDLVPVADEAGGNAYILSTQSKVLANEFV